MPASPLTPPHLLEPSKLSLAIQRPGGVVVMIISSAPWPLAPGASRVPGRGSTGAAGKCCYATAIKRARTLTVASRGGCRPIARDHLCTRRGCPKRRRTASRSRCS